MAEAQLQARAGWLEGSAGRTYPPEPWFLGGALAGSTYLVRAAELPREVLDYIPPDHRLLKIGRYVPVTVSFVHYGAGGALAYEELLVAVPVRRGLRLRVSILQIWVDSPSSVEGGRALWGIPKALAEFSRTRDASSVQTAMRDGDAEVAALNARIGGAVLPGRWLFPLVTAQILAGKRILSSNMIVGRLRRLHASWSFAADGPLAWLRGKRPLFSLMIDDAAIAFGQKVARR